ncbi:MAG: YicC family protein [Ignavibacteria bacterium]|nr:YicC family protein [Ignavibacteria bacterium]
MIVSMTGYGKAEGRYEEKNYTIEIRSVNNKFCEISYKYPKYLYTKDFELKDAVRKKISRGKLSIYISVDSDKNGENDFKVDKENIKTYYNVLKDIRKTIGSKEKIKLEHILTFSEFIAKDVSNELENDEFVFVLELLNKALDDLMNMKLKEGESLQYDIMSRVKMIETESHIIEKISLENIKEERDKLFQKVELLLGDKKLIDENRIEQEVVLLAEKLDISEECVRLRSHTKYFEEYAASKELAGRRLNFLTQEINREINTMASKSLNAEISQRVSALKEELEKIREQLQNIE